jgi:hypothetical protein
MNYEKIGSKKCLREKEKCYKNKNRPNLLDQPL